MFFQRSSASTPKWSVMLLVVILLISVYFFLFANKKNKELQNLINQQRLCDAKIEQKTKAFNIANTEKGKLELDLRHCTLNLEVAESAAKLKGSLNSSINSQNCANLDSELKYTKELLNRCKQITSEQFIECETQIQEAITNCDKNIRELRNLAQNNCDNLAAEVDEPVCSSKVIESPDGPIIHKKTFRNKWYLEQSGREGDVQDGACEDTAVLPQNEIMCTADYHPHCGLVSEKENVFVEKDFWNACEARSFGASVSVPGECSKYCSLNPKSIKTESDDTRTDVAIV